MATQRRDFLRKAGVSIAAAGGAGLAAGDSAAAPRKPASGAPALVLEHQGPKEVIRGRKAVAASQSPIVTQTMLDILAAGGNAVDATVAGCITQATVQPEMTNHTGTVSWLYWEAKTGKTYQLNSMGTLHPTLPPFRPYPPGLGGVAAGAPMACIPGFMPGMRAMHEKFGAQAVEGGGGAGNPLGRGRLPGGRVPARRARVRTGRQHVVSRDARALRAERLHAVRRREADATRPLRRRCERSPTKARTISPRAAGRATSWRSATSSAGT